MSQILEVCCSLRLARLAILCLVIILICATSTAKPLIPKNHSEFETAVGDYEYDDEYGDEYSDEYGVSPSATLRLISKYDKEYDASVRPVCKRTVSGRYDCVEHYYADYDEASESFSSAKAVQWSLPLAVGMGDVRRLIETIDYFFFK